MKKFYQIKWHNIIFSDFYKLSSNQLAGPEFYQQFYNTLFMRLKNWAQLPLDWRQQKESCAKFILSQQTGDKILSVGCGLGYMEHYIHASAPWKDLYIHEVVTSAWRWVGNEFREDRKIIGLLPDCMTIGIQFNLIYLSAVDYALSDAELIALLSSLRVFLSKGERDGRCLLISASFENIPKTYREKIMLAVNWGKGLVSAMLDWLGVRTQGQFWGWTRTREEYRSLLQRAGYQDIKDGFIGFEKCAQYWISGC